MLLQILLDAFRLALQERDVFVGDFEEMLDHVKGHLEFLGELDVLLIAPGVAEPGHLGVQSRQPLAQVAVELLEPLCKPPDSVNT